MLNRHRVRQLALEAGLPVTKQLKAWDVEGRLTVLEVERPAEELAEDLRELGLLPPPGRTLE